MSHDQLLSAVQRMIQAADVDKITEGIVRSVSGSTARVQISGATRAQEAWYSKGITMSPGDTCVLIRTPQSKRWIVLCAFSTSMGGANESLLTGTNAVGTSSANAGAYRNGAFNIKLIDQRIAGKDGQVLTGGSVELTVTKAYANVLAGFSGNLQGTSTLSGPIGGVRLKVGGVIVAEARGDLSNTVAASARANLSTSGLRVSLPAGKHVITVEAICNQASAAEVIDIANARFFATEI